MLASRATAPFWQQPRFTTKNIRRGLGKKRYQLTREQALQRLERYCAYQDRCHQEVERKLRELGMHGADRDAILLHLIEEGFLDEERFARSFVRGKFRMKGWGRSRLLRELKARDISDYCIRRALTEIDEAEYRETVAAQLRKKWDQLAGEPPLQRRQKLYRWALGRGYENELIQDFLDRAAD